MNDILEILKNPPPEIDNEIIKEPSKRWRNKWEAGPNGTNGICGTCGKQGHRKMPFEKFYAHCAWPSKEVAEERAFKVLRIKPYFKYLGAFPE